MKSSVEADSATVQIADSGSGVAKEDLAHLSDRFWRKDKSRSRTTGGSGLGLAICCQLVESQGGQIFVSLRKEGGLAISLTLPRVA